jgi:hypothetical protein
MKKIVLGLVLALLLSGNAYAEKTINYPDGSKYSGKIRFGQPYGYGTFTDFDGQVCIGEWDSLKNGKLITCTWSDPRWAGDKYVGPLKDGLMHGQGTLTFAHGGKYVGEWKVNNRHCQGTMTYSNGDKYVGEHRDDKRHGQGTYLSRDGENYVGEWKGGEHVGRGTIESVKQRHANTCSKIFNFKKRSERFNNCVFKLYTAELDLQKLELEKELAEKKIKVAANKQSRAEAVAMAQIAAAKASLRSSRLTKSLQMMQMGSSMLGGSSAPKSNSSFGIENRVRATCRNVGGFLNCY